MISNAHYILDLTIKTIQLFIIVSSAIPIVVIVLCKAMLLKRLHSQLQSGAFASATNGLRKAVFQAKLANRIALILLSSQIINIINMALVMVGWVDFLLFESKSILTYFIGHFW